MRTIRWWIGALIMLTLSEAMGAQKCPLQGKTANKRIQAANVLKNRSAVPLPADYDSAFTLDSVLAPGNDTLRWDQRRAGTLVGYVHNAKPGGIESVNCGAKTVAERDTHIELVRSPDDSMPNRRIIVEVTPRMRKLMRKQGLDWSTPTLEQTLKGQRVEISGWIFDDYEHKPSAENTNPHAKRNWRATVWELHPVTSIKIIADLVWSGSYVASGIPSTRRTK